MKNFIETDNKKTVIYLFWFLVCMLAFCLASIITLSLLPVPNKQIILTILSSLLVILFIGCINLKIFQYEDSGEIISIKYYHPMKRRILFPVAEFPNAKLLNITTEKTAIGYFLLLHVKSSRGKTIKLSYELLGFTRKQINLLRQSLVNGNKGVYEF